MLQPKVRTKYDRMFERKNQNILSEHFNKLVDHSDDGGSDTDDDFITLKRADHALDDAALPEHTVVSKRKQKMATSKKAIAKSGPKGHKLVFDEDGNAHEVYELKTAEEVFKGADDVKEAGRRFAEDERGRLKEADVRDREEAKEKKKEKKRKRKEREREVSCLPSVLREWVLTRRCRKWAWMLVHPWQSLTQWMTMDMLAQTSTCRRHRTTRTTRHHHLNVLRTRSRHWRRRRSGRWHFCIADDSLLLPALISHTLIITWSLDVNPFCLDPETYST